MNRARRCAIALLFATTMAWARGGASAVPTGSDAIPKAVYYAVRFDDPLQHRIHVTMQFAHEALAGGILPDAGETFQTVQLPVWNALYQVRDFSQFVVAISAQDGRGAPVSVRQMDKSSWAVTSAARVDYDIVVDTPGPYSAQFSADHAFINLAQILMYPTDARGLQTFISFQNIPQGWSLASVLPRGGLREGFQTGPELYTAPSYDALVDAPVEIGRFRELSFNDGAAKYRIVIDADPADYDAKAIQDSVRGIVHTEVEWMRDQPCTEYLFIYHFPRGFGGGGMEHACSTAIDVSAEHLSSDIASLQGVTAHEFFHLWNVKRIRPQSLEPVDYTKEQYTRALWFSEGVTSTVEDYILLRAGMIGESEYLQRLGAEINILQHRPAHTVQSAELSSLETWFDKYPFYRRPERSISYYNKGEILGAMLDLAIRDASSGAKSLHDLFLWMNDTYAKQGHFFPDSEGVRQAVETVTGKDLSWFFRDYVAGTQEIPYDRFLNTVGLRLKTRTVAAADAGFSASRNFDGFPAITAVIHGGEAESAGLKIGDIIVEVNGHANANPADELSSMRPGDTLNLLITSSGDRRQRYIKIKVGAHQDLAYFIAQADHPTPAQLSRRSEWLSTPKNIAGESERSHEPLRVRNADMRRDVRP